MHKQSQRKEKKEKERKKTGAVSKKLKNTHHTEFIRSIYMRACLRWFFIFIRLAHIVLFVLFLEIVRINCVLENDGVAFMDGLRLG